MGGTYRDDFVMGKRGGAAKLLARLLATVEVPGLNLGMATRKKGGKMWIGCTYIGEEHKCIEKYGIDAKRRINALKSSKEAYSRRGEKMRRREGKGKDLDGKCVEGGG